MTRKQVQEQIQYSIGWLSFRLEYIYFFMQITVNQKKTSEPYLGFQSKIGNLVNQPNYNQLLHQLYFAVCPYAIHLSSKIDSIFTLNFQKDQLIVGQLSTMIYPQIYSSHIQLDALKNVMIFRVFKNIQSDYKWVLYQRNKHGKQQMTEIFQVNLSGQANKFITQLKSTASNKTKLIDSKSLKNSSKIYESIHGIKPSQKGLTFNKKPIVPNYNSSVSTKQVNEVKSIMKQMKSKFVRSPIEVSYLFCIGLSEDQIMQTIKNFHLKSKFSIVNTTLKKTDQLIGPQIRTHSPLKNLDLIKQQIQFSHQAVEKNFEIDQSIKQSEQNNQFSRNIQLLEFRVKQAQKVDTKINYPKSTLNFRRQQLVLTSKKSDKPLQILSSSQGFHQKQQKNLSQLTNIHKTSYDQLDHVDFLQANPQDQIKTDLTETQKTQKHIPFSFDIAQDRELVQNTHTNTIYDKNPSKLSKLAPKSSYTDKSNLKLDDVILNGKRISVSDKSQWMITSKSKISDYDKNQQSDSTHKFYPKNKNQIQDFEQANNLQINSQKEVISLDLISLNPKLKNPTNQHTQIIYIQNFEKVDKIQDMHQNILTNNSILVIGNRFKLKKKSTAQDFYLNQNRIQLTKKPKTMEDSNIRKELILIKGQLQQGNWIDESEQSQEQQISTPMFKNYIKIEEKSQNSNPSMIDETVQSRRQISMSKSNSCQNPDPLNPNLNDNYDWGEGLSQISLQQTQQKRKFMQINQSLIKLFQVSKQYSEKYVKSLKEKLEQNPYLDRAQGFLTWRFNFKQLIIVIFGILFVLWVSSQLCSSSENSLRGISKKQKSKNSKQSRRKR